MQLKDILVCLDPTEAGEARLRLAAALALEHRAHLSAGFIMPERIPGAPPYEGIGIRAPSGTAWLPEGGSVVAGLPAPGVSPAVAADITRGAEVADIVEQRFREAVRPHAIEGDWHVYGSGDSADLAALARTVDLVVFGQAAPDYPLASDFQPADIVLASGGPMLVTPYAGAFAEIGLRVLVAWDDSREAARALRDALPLMAKAEAVSVMGVQDDEAGFDGARPGLDRVVMHLQRHGLPARREETVRGDLRVADVLLSRAADLDADLIVAGMYHRSRALEALFGGVSRDLLDHMTVPVLMSH